MGQEPGAQPRHKFWDYYIKCVTAHGISAAKARWYVFRAEQYLYSTPRDSIVGHRKEDVIAYLDNVGREGQLEDWQFQQLVHSLEILFVEAAKINWAKSFDWQHWYALSRTLAPSQPAATRQRPRQRTQTAKPSSVAQSRIALQRTREIHRPVIQRLTTEIRRRAYSIRTEQAYEQWVLRFLLFNKQSKAQALGAAEVVKFLEYLAAIMCMKIH